MFLSRGLGCSQSLIWFEELVSLRSRAVLSPHTTEQKYTTISLAFLYSLLSQVMGLASPDGEAKLVREITDSGFRRALQDGVKHDPA